YLHRLNWTGLEIDKLEDIFIDDRGIVQVKIKWFALNETDTIPLDDVLYGAHLLVAKYLKENATTMDQITREIVTQAITKRLAEMKLTAKQTAALKKVIGNKTVLAYFSNLPSDLSLDGDMDIFKENGDGPVPQEIK